VTDGMPVFGSVPDIGTAGEVLFGVNRFGKMLPLARAELSEGSWATARGKHQGVLGARDLKRRK
jgi:hypothetical protein